MSKDTVVIKNLKGLHMRPACVLSTEALKYQSDIYIQTDTHKVSAKSILGLLSAGIKEAQKIEIICEGEDEKEALEALVELIESGLGE